MILIINKLLVWTRPSQITNPNHSTTHSLTLKEILILLDLIKFENLRDWHRHRIHPFEERLTTHTPIDIVTYVYVRVEIIILVVSFIFDYPIQLMIVFLLHNNNIKRDYMGFPRKTINIYSQVSHSQTFLLIIII